MICQSLYIIAPLHCFSFATIYSFCSATDQKEMGLHLLLLWWLAATPLLAGACPPLERAALMAFRASLQEQRVGVFKSWVGADCCRGWYGVSCDRESRRVADVTLRGRSEDSIFQRARRTGYMTGRISDEICKLGSLSGLTLADWEGISGEVPRCITSLGFLRVIDLAGNKISGKLPPDLGRLQRLTILNLADNLITGGIPASIVELSSLMHLDLRNNAISGTIPADFGRLTMLSRVLLGGNRLTGSIPSSISKIYRLVDLDLSLNKLSGPVPEWMGKMAVLGTLNLDCNRMSGTIPASLMTSGVSDLNLSRNALQGTIPDVFGPRSYFTALDLSHNNLKGSIPKSTTLASYIGHFDVSHNHLCGPIPAGSPFDHLEASSFEYNDCLCGKPLKPC